MALKDKHYLIKLDDEDWLLVQENEPGVFTIFDDSLTESGDSICNATSLAFYGWEAKEGIVDLDNGSSDEAQCWNYSLHLKWNDVDLDIGSKQFTAPNLERLKQALQFCKICAYCPGDI